MGGEGGHVPFGIPIKRGPTRGLNQLQAAQNPTRSRLNNGTHKTFTPNKVARATRPRRTSNGPLANSLVQKSQWNQDLGVSVQSGRPRPALHERFAAESTKRAIVTTFQHQAIGTLPVPPRNAHRSPGQDMPALKKKYGGNRVS
eukprot:TRINITY_DN1693_c0_g1_i2.p1 TRINITY_DN1693_c0_g1~~TRINITY_DN1693_c0_g1_i2.p1  ORF type:complete len:144 (+),score=11.62 TRINITY_DN1693_c0_g1_i2:280-711(+)